MNQNPGNRLNLADVRDVPLCQPPNLEDSAIDMSSLVSKYRQELFDLLDACPGDKCLVLDADVAGALKLLLFEGPGILKQHSVVDVKQLDWSDLEVSCSTIVYFIRPEPQTVSQIASQMKHSGQRYDYWLFYVPSRSFLCNQLLRNAGVFQMIENNIFEYNLGFIPYESDVLSLGLDNSFTQVSLDGDDSSLMYSARAFLSLQESFGPIPDIQVKGNFSKNLLDMILRLKIEAEEEKAAESLLNAADSIETGTDSSSEESEDEAEGKRLGLENGAMRSPILSSSSPDFDPITSDVKFAGKVLNESKRNIPGCIDKLLLIDRGIDLVTPLCTALTYEALLDSSLGIKNGHALVSADLVCAESQMPQAAQKSTQSDSVSMSFNSSDHIFKQIRDLNIDVVLGQLNRMARQLKDDWQDVKGKEVEDLHHYVRSKLRVHVQESQLLPRHVNIVNRLRETVFDIPFRKVWAIERDMLGGANRVAYIEECIARHEPWTNVLRLVCLQSLTANGLPVKQLDTLRRGIINTYGFELIFALDKLEKLGMLLSNGEAQSNWSFLVNSFKLLPHDSPPSVQGGDKSNGTANAQDISYVTSGYAPLSVRLVELAVFDGWDKSQSLLKSLRGRTIFKVKQPGVPTSANRDDQPPPTSKDMKKKTMVVFFTGGVTFCEIAAIRLLSSRPDCPYRIIIASTTLMNGTTLLQSIAHKVENRLR